MWPHSTVSHLLQWIDFNIGISDCKTVKRVLRLKLEFLEKILNLSYLLFEQLKFEWNLGFDFRLFREIQVWWALWPVGLSRMFLQHVYAIRVFFRMEMNVFVAVRSNTKVFAMTTSAIRTVDKMTGKLVGDRGELNSSQCKWICR